MGKKFLKCICLNSLYLKGQLFKSTKCFFYKGLLSYHLLWDTLYDGLLLSLLLMQTIKINSVAHELASWQHHLETFFRVTNVLDIYPSTL